MTEYDTYNRKAFLMLQAAYLDFKAGDYYWWKLRMEKAFEFLEEAERAVHDTK